MSYFDDASLAFLPSGAAGKDGTAFSIKPTDGTGDFTFSRGSNLAATRVGADGLIEKGRENLFTQSNNFSSIDWVKSDVTLTSGQADKDGGTDAWLLDISGGTGGQRIEQPTSFGGIQTFSVYAKAGALNWIRMRGSSNTYFDLANGVIGIDGHIDSKIESLGNGWYRCSVVTETSTLARIYVATGDGNVTQSSGSVYIQDAQLEEGLAATDYIESGATTGKAGLLEDEPRFDYSGGATCPSLLLEPSRTNVLKYSEYFDGWFSFSNVTLIANNSTSPEGLINGTKITATSTSNSFFRDNIDTSAGNNVFSVFAKYEDCQYIVLRSAFFTGGDDAKVWFDIQNGTKGGSTGDTATYDIEDYGNGWYRCYVVFNVDVGDLNGYSYVYLSNQDESFNVTSGTSVHLYGAQVEAGSYPTSYIPNHSGGSVTRGADFMSQSANAANFNDSEGTIFFDGVLLDNDGSAVMAGVDAGNITDRIRFDRFGGKLRFLAIKDGSILFVDANVMSLTAGTRYKIAARYKANDYALYVNGVSMYTNTSVGTWDSGDLVRFAFSEGNDTAPTEANVNQALYFPEGLSDADLTTLTTI